jgi:hypothetical protein
MNTSDDIIFVASVMKPKASPFGLIRIGGNRDGAYLVPDDLRGISRCFSPGVSDRKSFEDELTCKYGITCHLCDASTSPERFQTAIIEPGQTFRKVWLHHEPGAADSVTLEEWVEDLSDGTASDLLLQMDIEGAEPMALRGAAQIMREHAPSIAACLYHDRQHLWEIPLQIAESQPAYRLNLRRYADECWELICYADSVSSATP